MVKKNVIILITLLFPLFSFAQKSEGGYQFEIISEIESLPVQNQYMSSTCWSFSTLSMLESELIRTGKGKIDLSEMFIVRNVYIEKAKRYVRMHGEIGFSGGGALNDVTDIIAKYGIVPNSVYSGLVGNNINHIHYDMDSVLLDYVKDIIEEEEIKEDWLPEYIDLLDKYLGKAPEKFNYEGKEYTPMTFAEFLDLEITEYVLLTSYTHHPFYSRFILEVPDNWSWGMPYNLPIDGLMQTIDASIEAGYSVAWASDVTELGFSWSEGIAIVPEKQGNGIFDKPVKELEISQELRQKAFDNYTTTDDHGMHIVGKAKDQKGNIYYYVKNSWGLHNAHSGYIYASDDFVKFKTMSVLVNKQAIPDDILSKLK